MKKMILALVLGFACMGCTQTKPSPVSSDTKCKCCSCKCKDCKCDSGDCKCVPKCCDKK